MLRQITLRQLLWWEAYAEVEPFGETREDWRAASVAATIANSQRDPKVRPQPYAPKDFLLRFESERLPQKPTQTWQQQKKTLLAMAKIHNKAEAAKAERKVRSASGARRPAGRQSSKRKA